MNSRYRYLILLLALLLTTFPRTAGAEVVDRVAAVVNREIITTYQLEQALEENLRQQPRVRELTAQEKTLLRREILTRLIEERLIRQRIADLGLEAGEEEIDLAIQDVLKKNQLTLEQLEQALGQEGMSFEAYRENLRQQILRFKLLGREVQGQVEVTSEEIRDYFREHIDEFREPPYVRLSRITFPVPPGVAGERLAERRRLAEEALARIRAGEDFYTVLLTYSADQRAQGGDMGTFQPGELSPAFERAITGLEEGGVSEVVETPQGFHLLLVAERSPGQVRQFDAVKEEIAAVLKERQTEERYRQWTEELEEKAYIDIRL